MAVDIRSTEVVLEILINVAVGARTKNDRTVNDAEVRDLESAGVHPSRPVGGVVCGWSDNGQDPT